MKLYFLENFISYLYLLEELLEVADFHQNVVLSGQHHSQECNLDLIQQNGRLQNHLMVVAVEILEQNRQLVKLCFFQFLLHLLLGHWDDRSQLQNTRVIIILYVQTRE